MKKKITLFILTLVAIAPLVMLSSSTTIQPLYARPWEDPTGGLDPVDIRSLGADTQSDVYLQGRVTELIVHATGTFSAVYYSLDNGPAIAMARYLSTDRYFATLDLNLGLGNHQIKSWTEYNGNEVESDTATFTIVSDYVASLYYEVDYMTGLAPSQMVLDYWTDYWYDRAIDFHYAIDDEVPYTSVVSSLYDVEAVYNDWEFQAEGTADDRRSVVGTSVFDSQEKWILFGSADSQSSTGGYTYVDVANHCGNYIMICCDMISNFETTYNLPTDGALLVVTMHEAGHSIGVLKVSTKGRGSEIYNQDDKYDIMSTMWPENCGFENHWYYAFDYWSTRDLSYY